MSGKEERKSGENGWWWRGDRREKAFFTSTHMSLWHRMINDIYNAQTGNSTALSSAESRRQTGREDRATGREFMMKNFCSINILVEGESEKRMKIQARLTLFLQLSPALHLHELLQQKLAAAIYSMAKKLMNQMRKKTVKRRERVTSDLIGGKVNKFEKSFQRATMRCAMLTFNYSNKPCTMKLVKQKNSFAQLCKYRADGSNKVSLLGSSHVGVVSPDARCSKWECEL